MQHQNKYFTLPTRETLLPERNTAQWRTYTISLGLVLVTVKIIGV